MKEKASVSVFVGYQVQEEHRGLEWIPREDSMDVPDKEKGRSANISMG